MSNPYSTPLTRALRAYQSLTLTDGRSLRPRAKHKQAVRLNPAQLGRLVAGYQGGSTVYELATEFRVSRKTVSRYLKTAGIAMQRSGHEPSQSDVDEMVRRYQQGYSLEEVGRRLGFFARTVERHLEAQGVERRDTHGRSHS